MDFVKKVWNLDGEKMGEMDISKLFCGEFVWNLRYDVSGWIWNITLFYGCFLELVGGDYGLLFFWLGIDVSPSWLLRPKIEHLFVN